MSLAVTDVTHAYGNRTALRGVTLRVEPGHIVGLLGANGAGKSTLLRTVAGLQRPDAGTVTIAGHEIARAPLEAKAALGYAAEDPVFHDELSAREHLAFIAAVRGLAPSTAATRLEELAARFDLGERLDEPVAAFSHGMRKKLSFLAAVWHRPRVLLCDEALEGFDAPSALEAKREIRALAAAGSAVLFSSHVTETVERLCDHVVVLRRGRVAATLARAEWGAPEDRTSPLEHRFLELIRTPESSS